MHIWFGLFYFESFVCYLGEVFESGSGFPYCMLFAFPFNPTILL